MSLFVYVTGVPKVVKLLGGHLEARSDHRFLVYQLCNGGNLAVKLKDKTATTVSNRVDLAFDILEVMMRLHARSILHFDLKLNNILLEKGKKYELQHLSLLFHPPCPLYRCRFIQPFDRRPR